jgi:ATP-dependent Clp protease adaptor protein ClpS
MTKEDVKDFSVNKEKNADKKSIVVYNDDVNTFDWVIRSLVEVCEHDPLQAEQCAMLVHYKGKCDVKGGSFEELMPKCLALLDRQISAKIE